MKANFLKIEKPCEEKWENMTPNEKGSFCDLCSKNVIDFTKLNQVEISNILSKSKGKICARVTSQQLKMPFHDSKKTIEFNFPFKNAAAGIMLTSTILGCQNINANEIKIETKQVVQNESQKNESRKPESKPNHSSSDNFTTFKGIVISEKSGKPIENAEITLVTIQKQITVHSLKDGTFSMEIPTELIDDDNVIRVTYDEIIKPNESEDRFYGYESSDYILNNLQLKSNYIIIAKDLYLYLGGIRAYPIDYKPVVLVNGKEITYKEFQKAQEGKKSTCDIKNKDYMYFNSKEAIAIFGYRAKDGLYILTDKK